jgi:RND family efflux transporter MFP subunit
MDDTAARLASLRIYRSLDGPADTTGPLSKRSASRRGWQLLSAIVLLTAIAVGTAGWLTSPRSAAPARLTTTSEPAADLDRSPPARTALDASGYVEAHRQATVSAKSIYRVRQILVQEGQRVTQNEVIARLDDSNASAALEQVRAQFAQAEATLQAAETAMNDADPIFRRNQQQVAVGAISAQAFDTAKATFNTTKSNYTIQQRAVDSARAAVAMAQRNQDDTIVRAPFSGVVTDIAAEPGEIVSPSTAGGFTRTGICTIVDMDSLEADVDVSENFIHRVHVGQAATARLNAYPDWELTARVLAIVPSADRTKATVRVRLSLGQKDPRILPSMSIKVAFLNESAAVASATASPRYR